MMMFSQLKNRGNQSEIAVSPPFSTFMTAIRASVVGPLRATSIKTSIAVCHSGRSDSFFGSW